MTETDSPPKCDGCKKTATELGKSLKCCAKCQQTKYCSRDCQKADWKQHKKVCASNAASRATTTNPNTASVSTTPGGPPGNSRTNIDKPFHKLNDRTWLHDRPEDVVFSLLIDAYRMRMEDDYKFGEPDADSLYGGAATGELGFRRFLRLAESRGSLLPQWWSSEKASQCVAFGRADAWCDLSCAIEKNDIQEHYANNLMPMQLRMFAEQVYESGPGGQSGAGMLRIQMAAEGGNMATSYIDAASMRMRS